jgi:hypothetical protein
LIAKLKEEELKRKEEEAKEKRIKKKLDKEEAAKLKKRLKAELMAVQQRIMEAHGNDEDEINELRDRERKLE